MKKAILIILAIIINIIASAQTKTILYFDSNKSELKTSSLKTLDSLTNLLKDKVGYQITINGYCDNTGIERFNQILSDLRAESVFNYFRKKNLSSGIISFKGFSSNSPIADNTSEIGKSKNRRVEILISSLNGSVDIETRRQEDTDPLKQEIQKIITNEIIEPKKAFSSTSKIEDLEVGKTLILQNLNFEGGTAVLLAEGKPTLDFLLKTMKENPTLEIEIDGHVCCFDDMPLSILRAKSVYNYLIRKGIDESRMTYKGFSRNKPIIADDRHEADAKVNRRVEITILKK